MPKANKKYYYGTGRRKNSIARVRLVEGKGKITINGKDFAYNNPVVPVGFMAINTPDANWNDANGWNNGLVIEDANGVGEIGNAKCGDIMKMYLKIENDIIVDVFSCKDNNNI